MMGDGTWPDGVTADDIMPDTLDIADDGRITVAGTLNYLGSESIPGMPPAEPVKGYLDIDFGVRRVSFFSFDVGTGQGRRCVSRSFEPSVDP
jgi:hypothetical protein